MSPRLYFFSFYARLTFWNWPLFWALSFCIAFWYVLIYIFIHRVMGL